MQRIRKSMRALIQVVLGLMIFAAVTVFAADEVKVIANHSVKTDTISAQELKSVFLLQRKTLEDGSPVIPVLAKTGSAHEAFLSRYLDRGSDEIRTYYEGLVFTGKGSMPKELSSDAEVVAYVVRTKGAIGYVNGATKTEGVKILTVVSRRQGHERTLLTRVEAEYPETLQRLGIGGTVRLQLTISPKGVVEFVSVVGGNPILGEAAMKAVKQWIYSPFPTQTSMLVTIPFEPHH